MRKDALKILLVTVVAGIFAMFLRWLQLLNAFDPVSGLPVPGAATSWVLGVYLLLGAAFLLVMSLYLSRQMLLPGDAGALKGGRLTLGLSAALGAVLVLTGAVLMFSAHRGTYPVMNRVLAGCAMLAGLCFPFLPLCSGGEHGGRNPYALGPLVFGGVWLLVLYRDHAQDPVVWAFAPQILAICAMTMGCYELAAYGYGRGRGRYALCYAQLGVFLSMSILADPMSWPMKVLFVVFAGLMLLLSYQLLANAGSRNEH